MSLSSLSPLISTVIPSPQLTTTVIPSPQLTTTVIPSLQLTTTVIPSDQRESRNLRLLFLGLAST
jgi:hypothetical protein